MCGVNSPWSASWTHSAPECLPSVPSSLLVPESGRQKHSQLVHFKPLCIWLITIWVGLELHLQENQVSHYSQVAQMNRSLHVSRYSRRPLASPGGQLVPGGPAEQNVSSQQRSENMAGSRFKTVNFSCNHPDGLTGIPSFPAKPGTPAIPCGGARMIH